MSNTTAPVSAPAAPAAQPTLDSLTTAQLSDRMTKLAERHDVLKASVAEFAAVNADLKATSNEFQKRFGITTVAIPASAKVKASKPKSSTPKAPNAPKSDKFPSLKEVVLTVLEKNTEGLDLNGIRVEVDAMIKRGEYASNAKSLSAVISQAINALKQEGAISRNDETKKYTKAA